MLDNVSLMDSLDSSYGSKPTASRDRGMRDMQTIHESRDDSQEHPGEFGKFENVLF